MTTGESVLLIHGSLCDSRYWRWQIPQLSETHRVIAPSLRGCWPDTLEHPNSLYSIATHAQDMIDLVRQQDPGRPVHVLGHSRGAHVALQFALRAPEHCKSLTLADPGFRFDHEPKAEVFYAPAVALLNAGQTDQALEQFIDTVNGAGTWHKMVSWFKDMVRDNAYTLLSQILEANLSVSLASTAAIDCPVLLIGGADSPQRYRACQDQLERTLPHVQRTVISMAAHGMNLANPRAFNRQCLDFFNTQTVG
ncbi:alpha/beta hydrolase [Alcaligenaceae bacterium CGII-47]|nr:alpha/beta hydrolase [Alcaligenaceae bacterium CGII-47]